MTKEDFLKEIQSLDPKARMEVVTNSDAPAAMKDLARKDASGNNEGSRRLLGARTAQLGASHKEARAVGAAMARELGADVPSPELLSPLREGVQEKDMFSKEAIRASTRGTRAGSSSGSSSPAKRPARQTQKSYSTVEPETAAERRRREDALKGANVSGRSPGGGGGGGGESSRIGETAAERRRREAALGFGSRNDESSDSEDDNTPRVPKPRVGIRFADEPIRGRK